MLQKLFQLLMQLHQQNHGQYKKSIPILIATLFSCILLIITVLADGFIGMSLLLVCLMFAYAINRQGFSWQHILDMSKKGVHTAMIVIQVFLFIGLLTATWQASGTMPAIIDYGLGLIQPRLFILFAFLLPTLVSYLIGTSLGTIGTIGLALIIMARAGGIPESIVTGAIIAGAYVGDRGSPMSSSAVLTATLTHTKVPENLPIMFKNALLALLISCALYFVLALLFPLNVAQSNLPHLIEEAFYIGPELFIPVIIMLAFILLRVPVKLSILASALSAAILAIIYQGYTPLEIGKFMIMGFELPAHPELGKIIHGGGLISMLGAAIVVTVSCALSSLIEGAGLLSQLNTFLERLQSRTKIFKANIIISWLTAAIGCSQSVSTVMTYCIMRTTYARASIQDKDFLLDLENTGIVMAALIPWNIAALVGTTMLETSMTAYLPFAFYLYLLPLTHWWKLKRKEKQFTLRT